MLNVNADTAAGEIAAAMNAERLVLLTDVEGVLDSSRRLIPRLTRRQARGLVRFGVVAGGMAPKIGACLKALEQVRIAHIIDGRRPHALKDTLTGKTLGTRLD
jgi:acetylglutamate kinase